VSSHLTSGVLVFLSPGFPAYRDGCKMSRGFVIVSCDVALLGVGCSSSLIRWDLSIALQSIDILKYYCYFCWTVSKQNILLSHLIQYAIQQDLAILLRFILLKLEY
jgi:hypothetical protein